MANESAADVVAIINAAADIAGLPRQLALGCAYAESRLNPLARRPSDPSKYFVYWSPPDPFDISGGLGQKIVRYMPPYLAWCTTNGHNPDEYPGDRVIDQMLDLLNDPREAAAIMCGDLASKWRIYEPSMERTLAAYNWPAGGGAFYSEAHAQNYRTGLEAAANILGAPMPTRVTYNQNVPAIAQDDDWSCAPTSLRWALTALGRNPGPQYIENLLVQDGVVSQAQGLLDASGAGLAAWIGKSGAAYYGDDGFFGNNETAVTFDMMANEGTGPGVNGKAYPLLLGGRAWNHWSGVRGYDAERDVLLLANPADGWKGVGQTMSRAQWDALGPWSMVRVLHPDLLTVFDQPPAPEPPVFDRTAILDGLRAALAAHDAYDREMREMLERLLAMAEAA